MIQLPKRCALQYMLLFKARNLTLQDMLQDRDHMQTACQGKVAAIPCSML